MILLDTNAAIAILNGRPPSIRARLADAIRKGETVALPSIVLFELECGVGRSRRRQENAERIRTLLTGPLTVLAFEQEDAKAAGELRAMLEHRGRPIGPFDVLIAGQALRHRAILVTANAREFKRVPGLDTESWASA